MSYVIRTLLCVMSVSFSGDPPRDLGRYGRYGPERRKSEERSQREPNSAPNNASHGDIGPRQQLISHHYDRA